MKVVMGLWILSLVAAVGTGWLTFSSANAGPGLHAVFLLSVGGFIACSMWALARGLSPLLEHDDAPDQPGAATRPTSDDDRS